MRGRFYISALGKDGITYYYHSDKTFRWYFVSMNRCYFKTWASLNYAKRAFEQLKRYDDFKEITLRYCEDGVLISKENEIIVTKTFD